MTKVEKFQLEPGHNEKEVYVIFQKVLLGGLDHLTPPEREIHQCYSLQGEAVTEWFHESTEKIVAELAATAEALEASHESKVLTATEPFGLASSNPAKAGGIHAPKDERLLLSLANAITPPSMHAVATQNPIIAQPPGNYEPLRNTDAMIGIMESSERYCLSLEACHCVIESDQCKTLSETKNHLVNEMT